MATSKVEGQITGTKGAVMCPFGSDIECRDASEASGAVVSEVSSDLGCHSRKMVLFPSPPPCPPKCRFGCRILPIDEGAPRIVTGQQALWIEMRGENRRMGLEIDSRGEREMGIGDY